MHHSGFGDAIEALTESARTDPAPAFAASVARSLGHLGATSVRLLQPDYGQRTLVDVDTEERLPIEGTVEGEVYAGGHTRAMPVGAERLRMLVVLRDGADRVGLLDVTVADDPDVRRAVERFGSVLAEVIISRRRGTDVFARRRRGTQMTLAAEMQWELVPPQTLSTDRVCVTGVLAPPYEFGGDVFDYALDEILHFGVFDCMGHGVQAALTATLVTGVYRHARRRGLELAATVAELDAMVAEYRSNSYATGVIGELDPATGRLTWVNAGHPVPKILRRGTPLPVTSDQRAVCLPLGMHVALGEPLEVTVVDAVLEPGDVLLVHTDGAVDPRNSGADLSEDRLARLVGSRITQAIPLDEVARQSMAAIAEDTRMADDATIVLVSVPGKL